MVKHDNCDDDDDDDDEEEEEEEAPRRRRRRRRKIGFHSRCLVDLCCAFQKFGSIQDVLGRLGPRCMKKVSPNPSRPISRMLRLPEVANASTTNLFGNPVGLLGIQSRGSGFSIRESVRDFIV